MQIIICIYSASLWSTRISTATQNFLFRLDFLPTQFILVFFFALAKWRWKIKIEEKSWMKENWIWWWIYQRNATHIAHPKILNPCEAFAIVCSNSGRLLAAAAATTVVLVVVIDVATATHKNHVFPHCSSAKFVVVIVVAGGGKLQQEKLHTFTLHFIQNGKQSNFGSKWPLIRWLCDDDLSKSYIIFCDLSHTFNAIIYLFLYGHQRIEQCCETSQCWSRRTCIVV